MTNGCLAVEHSFCDSFRSSANCVQRRCRRFRRVRVLFNAGFKWSFHDHVTLLASAGRTLYESRGEGPAVFSYLGLQLTF
jgi:hypothetical protein